MNQLILKTSLPSMFLFVAIHKDFLEETIFDVFNEILFPNKFFFFIPLSTFKESI